MLLHMSPVKPLRTRPTRGEVRDRILDAASKVFAAEGFAGATIDAIGQTAGFTKGAVYSNFESKDELFLALVDREFELRGEQIAIALDRSDGDTAAAAREVSRSVLDSVRDHSDYYVLLVEYWLRAQRDPQLRERLIERRRAAADQALHIVESTDTVPGTGGWPTSPSSSSPSTWASRWKRCCVREPSTPSCSRNSSPHCWNRFRFPAIRESHTMDAKEVPDDIAPAITAAGLGSTVSTGRCSRGRPGPDAGVSRHSDARRSGSDNAVADARGTIQGQSRLAERARRNDAARDPPALLDRSLRRHR